MSQITEDVIFTIGQQNLWQNGGSAGAQVPAKLAPSTERTLATCLYQWLKHTDSRHIQIILGPRRVGKTVVLHQIVRNLLADGVDPSRIFFLRLDNIEFKNISLGGLARYVWQASGASQERPAYLMLDEVVLMQDWDRWLKTFHDDLWPLRIVATSSARTGLKIGQTESGLDRWREQYMLPCGLLETLKLLDKLPETMQAIPVGETLRATLAGVHNFTQLGVDLEAYRNMLMQIGGFPGVLTSYFPSEYSPAGQPDLFGRPDSFGRDAADIFPPPHQIQLYEDVVQKSIYIDIPKFFKLTDPSSLEAIVKRVARQMGTLWEPKNVSQELGISATTLNNYTMYLEQASLLILLPNYPTDRAHPQARGKKLFLIDAALRNSALLTKVTAQSDPTDFGLMLENLVVSALFSLGEQTRCRLHHWRHGRDGQHEVDVIYNDFNGPLAFEVGSSPKHSLSGLRALIDKYPQFKGGCYLVAPSAPIRPAETSPTGIGSLPLDILLLVADFQAAHALERRLGF